MRKKKLCYLLVFSSILPLSPAANAADRDVVLVALDAVRADHLGAWGYPKATSPEIDAFAKGAVRYEYAVSSSSLGAASLASIFTGLFPSEHEMIPRDTPELTARASISLRDEFETAAELLRAEGYRTVGVSASPWIGKQFNIGQGFEFLIESTGAGAKSITDKALAEIELERKGKPLFLFVQFSDVLSAPSETEEYDARVHELDAELGRFLRGVKTRLKGSLVIIVGTYGAQLGDHGRPIHGLYNDEVHVPLIMSAPGRTNETISETVSVVDVLPTLLDATGTSTDGLGLRGVSLRDAGAARARGGVLLETRANLAIRAAIDPSGMKIIFESTAPATADVSFPEWVKQSRRVGIFDRRVDEAEKTSLAERLPAGETERLEKLFITLGSASEEADEEANEEDVTSKTVDELRSLGYLGD